MATTEQAGLAEQLLETSIDRFIDGTSPVTGDSVEVPAEVRDAVEVICVDDRGYKDAALTLLAFRAANPGHWDLTDRFDHDRGLSNWLGDFLRSRNIPAVRSALQNSSFRHGFTHERIGSPELRALLTWASDPARTDAEVTAVFYRIARRRAESARVVTRLPDLHAPSMTFARTLSVIDKFLAAPSGGAGEQYVFAGLKQAETESVDERSRVVTKDVNAADAGRVAGDVQVVRGQAEIVDAFEISAADWATKLDQAVAAIQGHALPRAHVVAVGDMPSGDELRDSLLPHAVTTPVELLDVSVLDLHHEVRAMLARLTKDGRRRAVLHVWAYLAEYRPDLTERFVDAVDEAGIAATP